MPFVQDPCSAPLPPHSPQVMMRLEEGLSTNKRAMPSPRPSFTSGLPPSPISYTTGMPVSHRITSSPSVPLMTGGAAWMSGGPPVMRAGSQGLHQAPPPSGGQGLSQARPPSGWQGLHQTPPSTPYIPPFRE